MISKLMSFEGQSYQCKRPENLPQSTAGPGFVFQDFTIKSRSLDIFCIHNCYINFDRHGAIVYDSDFNPIKEVSDCFDEYYREKIESFNKQALSKNAHFIPGETLSIIPFKAKANFSHFLLEGLPRLVILDEIHSSDGLKVIIDKNFSNLIEGFISASSKQKISPLYFSDQGVFKFERLYITAPLKHPLHSGNPKLKKFLTSISNKIKLENKHHKDKAISRLYVHRKQGRRGVKNEEDVIKILKKYGFHICNLEDYTLNEQAGLFSTAEIVIGVHGAGLSNIVFSTARAAALIEVFPEVYATPAFWYLSRIMGMKYFAVVSNDLKNDPSLKFNDVFVDCEKLESYICMAIESLKNDF